MRIERKRSAVRNYETAPQFEDLVACLARLIRHRGFARGEIGSPMLQRLVPPLRPGRDNTESELRQRIAAAELDPGHLAYLLQNTEAELNLAHARLAG